MKYKNVPSKNLWGFPYITIGTSHKNNRFENKGAIGREMKQRDKSKNRF